MGESTSVQSSGQSSILSSSITRRGFLAGTAAVLAAARLQMGSRSAGAAPLPTDPFTLGVASGDPDSTGFVLWTRLAPDPLNGGGMPPDDVAVTWEVATDSAFAAVVASGVEPAVAALAHSVHAEVSNLDAGSWYFYRFSVEGWTSPVGRARTTPQPGATAPLRFAFASCQSWPSGFYTAHAALAQEECDVVLFLGDYIYEGGGDGVRPHNSGEVFTLEAYRNRYALYKGDPNLQASHAMCPWVVTWDDHEVENNYAGAISQDNVPTAEFLERRAAAYQAWFEHQPVRLPAPSGPDFQIYRRLEWGSVATFHVLDTRQYRSDQVCGDDLAQSCSDQDDPARSLVGDDQEAWLLGGLAASDAVWQVLAQQVVFLPMPVLDSFNMDQWDGYRPSRQRVWDGLKQALNPLVITGDIHAAGVGRLHEVLDDPSTPQRGLELVGTSISSGFGDIDPEVAAAVIGGIPWVEYVNAADRGYTVVDMTATAMQARYRVVSTVTEQQATVSTDHTVDRQAVTEVVPTTTTTTTTAPANPPPAAVPVEATARFTG